MIQPSAATVAAPPRVDRIVAFAHVASVSASERFYGLFGFAARDIQFTPDGRPYWAFLACGSAELMIALAGEPVVAEHQAVLFYLYCPDVAGLRAHLLASGLTDGGRFEPGNPHATARRVVFEPTHPPYMPAGELRVHDPDGYCLLIGQIG
ncbi:MAG: hypothetical protein U1A27_01245 [Phycisphaerae bacterium]